MADSEPSLASAVDFLKRGDLAAAGKICDQVLAKEPGNAKAWHLSGIVHAQQNQLADAAECFEKAIELRADVSAYHYNLGLACQSLQDDDGALEAYRAAVAIKPDFLEAQNNLGNCLLGRGEILEAVAHFRELGDRFPDESILHFNIANVLQDAGEYDDSLKEFRRAIELDPDLDCARENLGRALSDVTRYDEALEVWKDWLEHDSDNAVARHMIASITGEGTPDRCDDDYVRETFDENFAKSYEKQLERIQYKVPELIGQAIESIKLDRRDLNVLDAGCGTGLCAAVLRPLAKTLTGVDLSHDMLDEARKRDAYDQLHEHELTQFLTSGAGPFDLIVSGDTLCYFGELRAVFSGLYQSLNADGFVVFTVERYQPEDEAEEDSNDESGNDEQPYQLQPNGRYRHAESFVRQMLGEAGLSIVSINTGTLRLERSHEVIGMIVTARR